MYTIKRAAELTGVPAATLRAWERRYAVVAPQRTPSGYRLYDARTLADLEVMNALVSGGWSPRQAADEVSRRRVAGLTQEPPRNGHPRNGGGFLAAATTLHDRVDGFVEAAAQLDASSLHAILGDALSRSAIESVIVDWLMPALRKLGEAWEAGDVSVAGEHLASQIVLRRLGAAYEAAGPRPGGQRIVVGLPPGAHHEIGALAFSVLARRAGADVLFVGPNLPAPDWAFAVTCHRAHHAVLAVTMREDVATAQATVAALRRDCPGVEVHVGGAGSAAVTDVHHVVDDLQSAALRLARG